MTDEQALADLARAASFLIDYLAVPSNALGMWIVATGIILGAFLLNPFLA